jgi:uncharacterized membrane protein YcaP (DUF421 family)
MIFDNWQDLLRLLLVGTAAYVALIVILRVTGKRTLSKMNAFDLVVTVALGSTLSAALMDSSISFAEACAAFGLLAGLQYGVTWASVRSDLVQRLVKSDPTLVFFDGRMIASALHVQRVTEAEILAAIRAEGRADTAGVLAVVLETDGSFSVLGRSDKPGRESLATVSGMPRGAERSR